MRPLLPILVLMLLSCENRSMRATPEAILKENLSAAKPGTLKLTTGKEIIDVRSENYNLRVPQFVILHHTGQGSCDESLEKFRDPDSGVSAHYLICKDGTINQIVSDYLRSWHAGSAKWGSVADINSLSIGIELDNSGFEPFPATQIKSLILLLRDLKIKYNIPASNFIGHADVTYRKFDPNISFPWKELARYGFGYMPDSTITTRPSQKFDPISALRIIGYDIKDTTQAMQAFRFHFMGSLDTGMLTPNELAALENVAIKYR